MKKRLPYIFKLGDQVRITQLWHLFQRDYDQTNTEEVFVIRFVSQGIPFYKLKDLADDPIQGTFYATELQKVLKDEKTVWRIVRFYANAKFTDSSTVHSDNKPQDFRVRLPRPLPMKGDWTVELTEFRNSKLIKTTDQEIFVYCSVCDDSIVGGSQKPLLRRIVLKNNNNVVFERPYRIPLRINDLGDTSTSYLRCRRARKSTIKFKRNHA